MVNQLLDNMDLEMQDQMMDENIIFGGNARWNENGVIDRRRVKYIARVTPNYLRQINRNYEANIREQFYKIDFYNEALKKFPINVKEQVVFALLTGSESFRYSRTFFRKKIETVETRVKKYLARCRTLLNASRMFQSLNLFSICFNDF